MKENTHYTKSISVKVMGNFLRKHCCPVEVENRKFMPCRKTAARGTGLLPSAREAVTDLLPSAREAVTDFEEYHNAIGSTHCFSSAWYRGTGIIDLNEYEKGCIDAAIRAYNADNLMEDEINHLIPGLIVNV